MNKNEINIKNYSLTAYALLNNLKQILPNINIELPDFVQTDLGNYDLYKFDKILESTNELVLGKKINFEKLTENTRLHSIFNEIKTKKNTPSSGNFEFPQQPLSLEEKDIMPNGGKDDLGELVKLFNEEYQEVKRLSKGNIQTFTETCLFLLKKYTSLLPISTDENLNFISLYEFLKVRAAMAVATYQHQESNQQNSAAEFIILCLDQSGIQDFIYNIASQKAAKSLKGRSFYLQMLMDSIVQRILKHGKINSSLASVLYSSGGKAFLILPNLKNITEALKDLEVELLYEIYEKHKGRLYLCMDYVELSYDENSKPIIDGEIKSNTGDLWKALREKTDKKKYQPFLNLMQSEQYKDKIFKKFFMPADEGFDRSHEASGREICVVTGEMIDFNDSNKTSKQNQEKYNLVYHKNDTDVTPVWVQEIVKEQSYLGYQLKQVIYHDINKETGEAIKSNKPKYWNSTLKENFNVIKTERDNNIEANKKFQLDENGVYYINTINNPQSFLTKENSIEDKADAKVYGFHFYGGNQQAYHWENGKIKKTKSQRNAEKDFSELAGVNSEDDKHSGFHRLGVLRMDVDNLGDMFTKGISAMPLAAYATLSAQLDLFFSGFLNTIRDRIDENGNIQETDNANVNYKYRDFVNILYSGGDDVFAVGRWDLLLDFAECIRNKFHTFACNRNDISISGGITLITPKFPIAKAADMAGEEEKKAKAYKIDSNSKNEDKNALAFLGLAMSWDFDFGLVRDYKKELLELLQKNHISMGFLQKILIHSKMRNEQEKNNETPRWIWMVVYDLSQAISRATDTETKNFIRNIQKSIFANTVNDKKLKSQNNFLDLLAVAARWTELEYRKLKNN